MTSELVHQSSRTASHVLSGRSEERILLIIIAFEAVQKGEENRVWDVTGKMGEVEVSESIGIYSAYRLVRLWTRK